MLSKKEFRRSFVQRTREARLAAGFTQAQIAEKLGIPQDKYKQYETRSMLPHEYIYTFCQICGIRGVDLYIPIVRRQQKHA